MTTTTTKLCGHHGAGCEFNLGTCPREQRGPIQRGHQAGAPRDFLCGKPIHCGAELHLLTGQVERNQGAWEPVRYETSRRHAANRVTMIATYVDTKGETHHVRPEHVFRWPPARPRRCTLCQCTAIAEAHGFPVCDYHRTRGEDDPACPACAENRDLFGGE